ncbi:hypothetical protein AB0M94_37305 [Streptomyces xanthochromogenes]|uniref:hypothetical protein n=1 Tax=Streptomyces xanthochromogenes TaxID=67384 RepID=UPI003449B018
MTTEDVLAIQFDRSGRHFALMRRGSIIELWQRDPPPAGPPCAAQVKLTSR